MGLYSDLSDEDLAAKITKYRDAIEEADLGGGVAVIQGENRRMELVRGNTARAQATLDAMIFERDKRANGGRAPGYAIGMRIGR